VFAGLLLALIVRASDEVVGLEMAGVRAGFARV
jgi:hypothetical protein